MEKYLSDKILSILISNTEVTQKQYLKCKLGIDTFVLNALKLFVVYFTAFIVGIPKEVLIFHISFFILRFFAYGDHAKTSQGCTLTSVFLFVGCPLLMVKGLLLSKTILLILGIANLSIILKFAPKSTQKNPIGSLTKKRKLKRKAISLFLIAFLISVSIPDLLVSNLIMMGTTLASILICPNNFLERGM